LSPLGRHAISFITTLSKYDNNVIYIDKYYLLDKGKFLLSEFQDLIYKKRIQFSTSLPFDYEYDFVIYTDSLPVRQDDFHCYNFLSRKSKIRICYPVFDGSVPPLHWIDIINNNFDICLTPSDYCAHNLIRFGVNIDCFGLNCVILIDELINQDFKKNSKKFRFGSIGAADFRKNIPLLIESFAKAFTKDDNVELLIHSSYGNDFTMNDLLNTTYDKYKDHANIILQRKFISHSDMIKLFHSFDAYLSPQTTTGYFTTPVEALSIGIPTIISDIPVHRELKNYILDKNHVFFVKHDILESAFHWCIDYMNLGVKFNTNPEVYVDIFSYIYNQKDILFSQDLMQQRRNAAKNFTSDALASKYNSLISPSKVCISNKFSSIENDIFYMSKNLLNKYFLINDSLNIVVAENIAPKQDGYKEEQDIVFQKLEDSAVESQRVHLLKYKISLAGADRLLPKYLQKIIRITTKNHCDRFVKVLYYILKIYCTAKRILLSPKRKLSRIKKITK